MGRLLPQKPPRRYPSGFCNLLDTERDQESFRPVPDLQVPLRAWSSARARCRCWDGFSPLWRRQKHSLHKAAAA